jgi:sigma-B regulation protein RsbU (phosphoserine phosphatase)
MHSSHALTEINASMTDHEPASVPTDHLDLLYQLTKTFNSSLDLEDVLNTVMDEIIKATGAERGFLMLKEEDDEFSFGAARGIEKQTIEDPEFEISRTVVDEVAESGKAVLTSDAVQDPRFTGRQSVMNLNLRSILCAPLQLKDKVIGVVYADNRIKAGLFGDEDLALFAAIASSAAVAIENARLYKVALDQGRMERELQMARKVQASLMPDETPEASGWQFAARWLPAREVAGDFYDFIDLGGDIIILIADVTDKGMPAALFMALTRSIVRASLENAPTLSKALDQANRLICADSTSGMPVSLFCGRLSLKSGELRYVNAGHNPPLLHRAGESGLGHLNRTGMVLGVDCETSYEEESVILNAGDTLKLITDGVTDAINPDEEQFGLERLETFVDEHEREPAEDQAEGLIESIGKFSQSASPFDDLTLIVVKRA